MYLYKVSYIYIHTIVVKINFHNHKFTSWLITSVSSILKTNYFRFRYTLQASTFQMAVLLQYNVSETWTIQQLQESTQLKLDFLIQVVQILLKAKLLQSECDENQLHINSNVSLFTGYKK